MWGSYRTTLKNNPIKMTNTVPWAHWKSILNIVMSDQGLLANNWRTIDEDRGHRVHLWLEMSQGMGVLCCSLSATHSTCPWRLQYLELNIHKQHGNSLAQTTDSETMEVACCKCQPHLLEDWQTLMQLGIWSAVHHTSPPSSGYTMSFSTSHKYTRQNLSKRHYNVKRRENTML